MRTKAFFRRWMVRPETVLNSWTLRTFAPRVADPAVWHLNRRSAARAIAVGLFWMIIPIPWQVVPAAICAVYFRANIAITVAVVCISNPLTWAPLLYGTYQLGRWILDHPPMVGDGASLAGQLSAIWQPLFLGSVVSGAALAVIGFYATHLSWTGRHPPIAPPPKYCSIIC